MNAAPTTKSPAPNEPWHRSVSARWIVAYLSVVFAASLAGLVVLLRDYGESGSSALDSTRLDINLMYFAAGCMGGTLYCLRLFIHFAVRSQLDTNRYWIWYVMRPVLSGGLGVMGILLFRSEILIITVKASLLPQVGLAFLIGYGFGKIIRKLEDTIVSLFGADRDRDAPG